MRGKMTWWRGGLEVGGEYRGMLEFIGGNIKVGNRPGAHDILIHEEEGL